jgi:hypothetical protein
VKKAEGGGRFEVAMTAPEKRRFLDGISDDFGAYYNMLGRVNVERSECSRAADRESIHAGIRDSVGFGALGRMVFGVMEEWMVEELRAEVAARQRDGDERGRGDGARAHGVPPSSSRRRRSPASSPLSRQAQLYSKTQGKQVAHVLPPAALARN